ncbi:MAG: SMC family ATPase [Anaerolineales bacterium]|nr:SMC family ATPase [Anaerolineales bacterium]
MIPITLSLSGFLSYRETVEIDFTSFDVACIAGRNGAGKSSILDAITWALFGQARQRGEAVVNTQSERAEVVFVFQYEGNLYRVQRTNQLGKTGMLEFHIAQNRGAWSGERGTALHSSRSTLPDWKPLTERTMRDTQEQLEEILRLDYETFINAAFFLQGKADQFTQQRPGDRKRILASILGLEVWENYRKRTVERRKSIEGQMATLDGRLSEINSELAEENERKARLKELEGELDRLAKVRQTQQESLKSIQKTIDLISEQRKMVDVLAQRLTSTKERESELELRLVGRQKERESYLQTTARARNIKDAYRQWQDVRDELDRWDEVAGQFREHEKHRQEPRTQIDTERARLSQELENLQARAESVERRAGSVSDIQLQISNIQSLISDLQSRLEERKSLENELAAAQDRLANAKAENPRLKAEMEGLKARIDQLTETDGAASVCPLCGQALSPDERQRLIDELSDQGTEMGDKFRANRQLLDEADQMVADLQAQIADLQPLEDDLREHTRGLDQLNAQVAQIEAGQKEWEKDGKPRLEEIQRALKEDDFAPEARAQLAQIDTELKEIGYDAASHDAARRAETEGRVADEEFRLLEKAQAAAEPLEREISDLQSQISDIQTEIDEGQTAHDEAAAALAAAEEGSPDLRQAQRDLLDFQEQENQLRMEVGVAMQKVLVLDDLKERRGSLEAERETFAKQVGQYKQLEKAFGKDGVPALLIEQALPTIEARANEILDRLSGGDMSIRFETQRELKSRADLKETLEIQIRDRVGMRDYEMYSGGEAFRVNFAIRLALSEMLAQRAGARLQTLVIDEGFGSQDEVGRQRLLEAINMVKSDFEKILVITHIDELKDAFPARIEVEKTERGSVVRVV